MATRTTTKPKRKSPSRPAKRTYARKTKPEKYLGYQDVGWLAAAQSCDTTHIDETVAFNFSAWFNAVNGISDDVMILPLHVYRRIGERRMPQPDNPVSLLFRRGPNPEMDLAAFIKYMVAMRLAWGNGYAEIVRSQSSGYPEMLIPIHARRVRADRTEAGMLFYVVQNPDGTESRIPHDDMLHIKGLTHDGVTGLSVVGYAREGIGTALAAEKHGHQFFGNSARPGLIIKKPRRLGPDEEKNLRRSMERYNATGSRYGVLALEEGTTIEQIGMPHADAQFLETRIFQIQEICRWFRLAPNKLGDYSRATFSNIEECNLQHVNDVILPEVVRFELELIRKLLPSPDVIGEDLFIKFGLAGLLRGNSKARGEYYKYMTDIGAMSINEVRAFEEMNPIGPDGDKHRVMVNTIAVEDEAMAKAAEPVPSPIPVEENVPDDTNEDDSESAMAAAANDVVFLEVKRMKRKECKAIRAAAKRYKENITGMGEWLDGWMKTHLDELCENLTGPMKVYAMLVGRGNHLRMARELADKEIAASEKAIRHAMLAENHEAAIIRLVENWEALCVQPK